MRALIPVLLGCITACAAAPPPSSAPVSSTTVARAAPTAPEPPPPPTPRPLELVAFEQKFEFVALRLGRLSPAVMADEELIKRLPAGARTEYQAVAKSRKAVEAAAERESDANASMFSCDTCPQD